MLGDSADLVASGVNNLVAFGANVAWATADGGKTWFAVTPPPAGSGLALDPASPRHAIAGGNAIQVSADGGATWKPSQAPPPGKGPYQPIAISPFDGNVWFFVHQNRLLRTRDGSLSWSELSGLPSLSNIVLVAGQVYAQFFLASGNRVFQLIDNGQRINELPPLPQGSVTELAVVDGSRPVLLARAGASGRERVRAERHRMDVGRRRAWRSSGRRRQRSDAGGEWGSQARLARCGVLQHKRRDHLDSRDRTSIRPKR